MNKRLVVTLHGVVQGIGFRYAAQDMAREALVSGWVKNESDGTVQIVAEGDENDLKAFIDQIKKIFSQSIDSTESRWEEATGEFEDFRIKY